jgi:transposase-like protein
LVVGEGNVGLASASESIFGDKHSEVLTSVKEAGKVLCKSVVTEAAGASAQIPNCPNGCKTGKIYRDGLRYNEDGSQTQRWLCTCCGQRFSDKPLKSQVDIDSTRQICAKEAKNLHALTKKNVRAGVELSEETKALLTVFDGWLQKEGYSSRAGSGYSEQNNYHNTVTTLAYLGADLRNPENVKAVIGARKVKDGTKIQAVYGYDALCKMLNLKWEKPTYTQEEIIPWIPFETELDQLIASARSRRMAAYLQTLKETFADPSEALRIEWTEIAGNFITINHPVKGHLPRTLEVSNKLLAMLNCLPHKSSRIFPCSYRSTLTCYIRLRKRVALITKNDRINRVELRSFRHWGGTMIAHYTNGNVLMVKKLLGHKRIENTMKYIGMINFKTDDYEVQAAQTVEECKALLMAGFNFVMEKCGVSLFRRPKRFASSQSSSPVLVDKRGCNSINL